MKRSIHKILTVAATLPVCLLVSCSGTMDPTAMAPTNAAAARRTGQPVISTVVGGSFRSNVLANVSNEDFKNALESSLVKSGLFKSVGNGGYLLEASIISVQQPLVGISMRVNMDVDYTLKRNGSTVWRKNINSTYSAPVGEALVGAVRVRKATEGASRENIANLVRALDEAKF
jgi:hypothetical protein